MIIKNEPLGKGYYKTIKKQLKNNNEIIFQKGKYRFNGDFVKAHYYALSNNEAVNRKIFFHINKLKNVHINGNGSTFLFDDFITGFGISKSENIVIENFTIDYSGNGHFEAEIGDFDKEKNRVELIKRQGFPIKLKHGRIVVRDREIQKCLVMNFDKNLKKPVYRNSYKFLDFGIENDRSFYSASKIYFEGKKCFLQTNCAKTFEKGRVLVFTCTPRIAETFFINQSKNITLKNINIHYSPAMGVISQVSENITLDNVNIIANGKHGMLASLADATHFVQCSGKIIVQNCSFFNMMDDGLNIHGNYTKILEVKKNVLVVKIMHNQQKGVNFFIKNDKIKIYNKNTIDKVALLTVKSSKLIDKDKIKIKTKENIRKVKVDDTVFAFDRMPSVEIYNTKTGSNRPRGFLISTSRKTYIHDCVFSNCEHGIECAGDTTYWFESGSCNGVTIENCLFDNCNYTDGYYPIMFRPEFDVSGKEKYYHKNVIIKNNKINSFTGGLVFAKHVKNLSLLNNTIFITDKYKYDNAKDGMISTINVKFNKVENNKILSIKHEL